MGDCSEDQILRNLEKEHAPLRRSVELDSEKINKLVRECAEVLSNNSEGILLNDFSKEFKKYHGKKLKFDGNYVSVLHFVTQNLAYFIIEHSAQGKTLKLNPNYEFECTPTSKSPKQKGEKKDVAWESAICLEQVLFEKKNGDDDIDLDGIDISMVNIPVASSEDDSAIETIKLGLPDSLITNIRTILEVLLLQGGVPAHILSYLYLHFYKQKLDPRKYGFLNCTCLLDYLEILGHCFVNAEDDKRVATCRIEQPESVRVSTLFLENRDLPELDYCLEAGKVIKLVVFEIYCSRKFYFIPEDFLSDYKRQNQNMTDFYTHYQHKLTFNSGDVKVGMYVAYLEPSGFWQRCRVDQMIRIGVFRILCVDDGATYINTEWTKMRKLALRFCFLPELAVCAGLHGVEVTKPKAEAALKMFKDFVSLDNIQDKVLYGIVRTDMSENTASLQIILQDQQSNNLNQMMVTQGLAKDNKEKRLLKVAEYSRITKLNKHFQRKSNVLDTESKKIEEQSKILAAKSTWSY